MADAFAYLILLSGFMLVVSLVFPDLGLFFAARASRTRFKGIAFWMLAMLAFFALFGVVYETEEVPSTDIKIFFSLFAAVCLFLASRCIKSSATSEDNTLATPAKKSQFATPAKESIPAVPVKESVPVVSVNESIPAIPVATVVSGSAASREYHLDAKALSCTCPEWVTHRAGQPRKHPSRLCKHLVEYFSHNLGAVPDSLRPYRSFIKERADANKGFPVPREGVTVEYGILQGTPYIMEAEHKSFPWVNFLLGGKRYGYSQIDKRWARGDVPMQASVFEKKARSVKEVW